MIILVNTLFITLLFSFWVWTLKQDIEELKHVKGSTAEDPETVPVAEGAHPKAMSTNSDVSHVKRDRNGVPTWTIG